MKKLGLSSKGTNFDPSKFSHLISRIPMAPFTGSGATGVNPTELTINFWDKFKLAVKHKPTRLLYSGPISSSGRFLSLESYLNLVGQFHRKQQAELLLRLPITSAIDQYYGGRIPSRAQVITTAAALHGLRPEMLAAFFLAEQRDQSRYKDAAEYYGATSILQADLTLGLGQLTVSAIKRHNLFCDLLSERVCSKLSRKEIVLLILSEEFNIFAVARYIRQMADLGSTLQPTKVEFTRRYFPKIDLPKLSENSSDWPDDNIRLIASNYTSTPWNDLPYAAWAEFVIEAYRDVIAAKVY